MKEGEGGRRREEVLTYIAVCTCVSVRVCIFVCLSVCMCVCACVCMRALTLLCLCPHHPV